MMIDPVDRAGVRRIGIYVWLVLCFALPLRAVDWPTPVSNPAEDPYRFVGFIYDSKIYATGFVAVDERLVFSGAHVFTDEWGNMEPADSFRFIRQFHQSDRPTSEGQTIRAAVIYTGSTGFAALLSEHGVGSLEPFAQDIGIAYGYHPMSNVGAMTLLEDGAEKLKSTLPKKIIGYPVGLYRDRIRSSTSPDQFKIHQTLSSTTRFEPSLPGDDRLLEDEQDSLENTPLASIPGNSGGPVLVETSPGNWAAAGILVGSYGAIPLTWDSTSGLRAGTSIVRAVVPGDWAGLIEPTLTMAIGKPVFDVHPSDATVLPGDTAYLHASATGYGEITYQWFKNDMVLTDQTREYLTLESVQPVHSGTYTLQATNTYGSTVSEPATITVPTGPVITEQPQSFFLSWGSRGTFRFKFYAAETYEIKFYRNGVELESWLRVPEYHIYDEGEYYAVVSNPWGEAKTDTITVTVEVDSSFISEHPEGGDRIVGESIDLSLTTVNRNSRLQWYKDGEILPGAIDDRLYFAVRGPEDEGSYYAVVDTGRGFLQSKEATIRVEESSPRFQNYVPATLARIGAPVRLGAMVGGSPPLDYEWIHNDRILPGVNGPYLDLASVTASDFGYYSCRVSNSMGSFLVEGIELKSGLDPFWTPLLIASKFEITALAQNDTHLVATTRSGTLLTTSDGFNWAEHELSRYTTFNSVTWGDGQFVVVGRGIIATSPDGNDWTVTPVPLTFIEIRFGNGIYIASEARYGLFTSPNGLGWSHVLEPQVEWSPYETIAFGDEGFLASNRLFLATSPDASTWTVREWQSLPGNLVTNGVGEVIYENGQFLAKANGKSLIASPDGIDWTTVASDGFIPVRDTNGSLFVDGDAQGLDQISSDGTNWETLVAKSLENIRRYYVFKGRILAFGDRGSGVISPDLTSPIRVLRPPLSQSAFAHRTARLEVTLMPDPAVTFQWFRGPLAEPVHGATSASLVVGPADSGNYWVRLTRGGDVWESEPVQVNFVAPGFYLDADEDEGTAIMLSETGTAALVAFDRENRTIISMPTGSVTLGDEAELKGASYRKAGVQMLYHSLAREGFFGRDSLTMKSWTGSAYLNTEYPRSAATGTPHPAAGHYRFGLTGMPYSEGSAIVDENGTAVVVMHTANDLVGGAGELSSEDVLSIEAEAERRLSLEFDPIRSVVSGTYTHGDQTLPVSGLRQGSEHLAGLANLSSRGSVRTGDGIMIAGLVLQGSGPADLLIRGIGPALIGFDVPNALQNPRLKVIRNEILLAENEKWGDFARPVDLAAAHQNAGAFALEDGSLDAAILMQTEPGSFTVHVEGAGSGTGTALAEVYHLPEPGQPRSSGPRLLNLSIRGFADRSGDPLVIGFVIDGDRPRQVFIRAVGSTLSFFNVEGVLQDPKLTLYQGTQALATAPYPIDELPSNYESNLATIATTVGAFPTIDPEPTLAVWLDPGAYTAVVQPMTSAGGIALVEIYEIPFDVPAN